MSADRLQNQHDLIDPDPIAIYALIFSGISAASGVASLGMNLSSRIRKRRKSQNEVRAQTLRWEAELLDFEAVVGRIIDLFGRVNTEANTEIFTRKLEPLQCPLMLTPKELREYRSLYGKLTQKAKKLSDATIDLIAVLDDPKYHDVLERSLPLMRNRLRRLKTMDSHETVTSNAVKALTELKDIATYLQDRIRE